MDANPSITTLFFDGIFWISRTGAPWRDLPDEFGKWSIFHRQFLRWTLAAFLFLHSNKRISA